jgi:HEAT repeat protein
MAESPSKNSGGAAKANGGKAAGASRSGRTARSSGGISIPEFPDEVSARAEASTAKRTSGSMAGIVHGENSGTYLAFAAVPPPKGSASDLLPQLDATKSVNITTRLLDDLVTLAENMGREGRSDVVGEIFAGVVAREMTIAEADLRRAYAMALRRMSKPTLLRSVSMLLPRRRDQLDEYMAVLARAGEDGADALIEQLTAAQSLSERRIYFDCLVKLKAGVPALIHMLGDARWYVARNAADLLGEMQAPDCESPLAELLKHDDDRVRRAATTALGKVGTTRAMRALHEAMQDTSPQVRIQAAAGLAGRKGARSASTLAKALETESDVEVQLAILSALGRVASPDAVQKLAKAAEPEGRLFKKKSLAFRIAAVQALGEARTPAALAALESLREDKEKEVRDTVFRTLLTAAREAGSERQA